MDKEEMLNNLCCDLSEIAITNEIEITRNVVLNEVELSILLCGLTLYKDSLERLKTKTEFICKEIRRINDLKKKLQSMAIEIEEEYDERN